MIIEFRVKNHRSFREEQTLSMVASNYDKSLPENLIDLNLLGLADTRLVKAAAVYGQNAGGKTNVLLAIQFLKWMVVESATGQRPDAKLPAEPFCLDRESTGLPTTFDLTFVANGVRYELAVAVTKDRVEQERLVAYPNGKAQVWYDRVWNDESQQYDWSPEKPSEFPRDPGIVAKTRSNALFLSTAAQWNNAQVAPIYMWFATNLGFLNLSAEASRWSLEFTSEMAKDSEEVRRFVTEVLSRADLGLSGVDISEQSSGGDFEKAFGRLREVARELGSNPNVVPDKFWKVTFQHRGKDGENFPISWTDASSGTRRLFSVLGPWLFAIQNNLVMCVDELEASMHPVLAEELLRLLFKITEPKSTAQILFTTHNPLLLDTTLLRRDQVWFADKTKAGESFLYPLTEYKPRVDESLVRGYMSGRYGAIPRISHGLSEMSGGDLQPTVAAHAS